MDISTIKLYEEFNLTPKENGAIIYDPERLKRIDMVDGREDGKITEENAWEYLSRNKSAESLAFSSITNALFAQLNNRDQKEQTAAVRHIVHLNITKLIPELISVLNRRDHDQRIVTPKDVRLEVIRALGHFQTKDSIEAISNIIRNYGSDDEISSECIAILSKCTKRDLYELAYATLKFVSEDYGWVFGHSKSLTEKAAEALKALQDAHYNQQ